MENKFRSACVKKLPASFSINEINLIKNTLFDSSKDDGFLLLSSSENNKFFFQYLRRILISYGEYNGSYIKKTEKTIKEMKFELDLENKIIIIYSGKSQSEYFARKLITKFGYFLSSIEVDFSKLIDDLTKSEFIVRSEQAVINGFVYKEIMVGKYIADIKDIDVLKNVLRKYNNKVEKIKLTIEDYNDNVFTITIDKNGTFLFKNFKDENAKILNYLVLNILLGDS